MGALAGAGGLYSTAADLARFLRACLTAAPAALAPAIRATLTPRQPIPGGEIGLAWHHARRGDRTIAWHNGMTGGFSAMIALDLARGLGVAALANTAGAPPSPLDQAVLSAFEPRVGRPGQRLDWRVTSRQGTRRVPWAGSPAIAASSSPAATRPTSSRHMSTLVSGGWAPSAIGSQLS